MTPSDPRWMLQKGSIHQGYFPVDTTQKGVVTCATECQDSFCNVCKVRVPYLACFDFLVSFSFFVLSSIKCHAMIDFGHFSIFKYYYKEGSIENERPFLKLCNEHL